MYSVVVSVMCFFYYESTFIRVTSEFMWNCGVQNDTSFIGYSLWLYSPPQA